MSLVAPVEDGKVIWNTNGTESPDKTEGVKKATGNSMDKESFLQLLVAQMKYQDPLQPTSNTEYIAQYAQFSQVESLQNMSSSMDLQRAGMLVGKEVYVQTTTKEGESKYVRGKVDYVSYEGGKAYVYINENRYSLDEVESIVDPAYQEAYDKAMKFVTGINRLPNIAALDLSDGETIDGLKKLYDEMDDYQKSFVAKEKADVLNQYVERLEELRKAAEGAEETPDEENPEGSEDTEEGDMEVSKPDEV